ncbi:MAG: helix-turn-helix transcriptional regulator [Thermomicrobiales bacterium]|nr:helix-turn-helix transcriptional regulator [Thermomicrobiales bacterium]
MEQEFLSELFASRLRAAVLGFVVPRPHRGYSLTELSRNLDLPISSLQHECYKLERIGILISHREGSSRRYSVNPDFPLRRELTALIVGALGQKASLQATLEHVQTLESAFIAAALPLDDELIVESTATIPLVLVGDIPLEEIDAAQSRVADMLGLPTGRIEAVYYLPEDWQSRVAQRAPYAVWLLEGPRTHLLGEPVAG